MANLKHRSFNTELAASVQAAFKNKCTCTCSLLHTHLKLVKTEEAGFIAYLHGNGWYGIIGEHFP